MLEAVINSSIEEVKKALDNGEDINFQNYNGNTALMLASYNNEIEIVKLLLEYRNQQIPKKKYRY